jgi:hypothetical protein
MGLIFPEIPSNGLGVKHPTLNQQIEFLPQENSSNRKN